MSEVMREIEGLDMDDLFRTTSNRTRSRSWTLLNNGDN